MHRFFEAYAYNTSGVLDQMSLISAAWVTRLTGDAYEQLLNNVLIAVRSGVVDQPAQAVGEVSEALPR